MRQEVTVAFIAALCLIVSLTASGVSEPAETEPSAPFLIDGYVFYEDGSECNDPMVNITNLNQGERWEAETDETSNYYQLLLSQRAEVTAGDILKFNAVSPSESQLNITEHVTTLDELESGRLSINLTLSPPPCVSIDPPDLNGLKGETFTVNITVDPHGREVYGAQYDLCFDPAILQVANQRRGNFLRQDGSDSYVVVNRFNNTLGKLEYGEMRIGTSDGVTGAGVLAMITFNLAGCGSTSLTLSNVLLSDPSPAPIPGIKTSNGSVRGCIYGDLAPYPAGNCVVDMGDVIRLLNHVHDKKKYPINEDLADLDRDGEIDMDDVMLLLLVVGDPDEYEPESH
ncbi:Cohesin domain protein [Candidatus Methanoperedenaceae archaeon GB50]|nr:Cohesin domain protein [Candidatus Methanoperedenaceae archaeon GB50]CAD7778339.1 MAG: Cohesin domain protein [Candidatus Methanoperedenaceae archaeon GB50]